MSGIHSKVGASGAHRWMVCPGSVRLSAEVPDRTTIYAAEGTVAHELAEKHLKGEIDVRQLQTPHVRHADGFDVRVDAEMIEAVQEYIAHCQGLVHPEGATVIEARFHLADLHPELFGTADFIHYHPLERTLYVRDYKHGAGVAVEAEGNVQLKYYALGALLDERFSGLPVARVDVGIVQPRCAHPAGPVRTWELDPIELLDWSGELVEAVQRTEAPDAPLVPGEHCRFCPAAGLPCPEIEREARRLAAEEFDPVQYDPNRLAETLRWVDEVLEPFCKRVREFAYAEAEHGRVPPGWKLVAKRAVRRWRDEQEAERTLLDYGLDEEDLYTRKLKSPAQVEKIVGKANKEDIAPLIVAESSGHALVPESDPRPPARPSAADDFAC